MEFNKHIIASAGPRLTDPAKVKAAATYNAAADHFDDTPLAFWSRYGQRTVDRLGLTAGDIVLDVGCGSGASAIPAAQSVGPVGQVIGVDLSERLLELGRDKAARSGLRNVEFLAGDMESLGYKDGQFDAVISVFSIFFIPDMERQVAELWRMVQPGGTLAITTWGPGMFEPAASFWWDCIKEEQPELHTAYRPWDRINTPDSLGRLLQDAGVLNADIEAESGTQALRAPQDWWTVVKGSGYRWTADQMDPDTRRRVRDANIRFIRTKGITEVTTNVIYAVARKGLR